MALSRQVCVVASIVGHLILASPTMARVTYRVFGDTSPLRGVHGYIDIQMNPGGRDALSLSCQVANVKSDGHFDAVGVLTGNSLGALPGPLSISNSEGFNNLFQGVMFGNQLSFDLTIDGPALHPTLPLPSSGTTFALSLYGDNGSTPLLTSGSNDATFYIDFSPDGGMLLTRFADAENIYWFSVILLPPVLYGDANSDGSVNLLDVIAVLQAIGGANSVSNFLAADVAPPAGQGAREPGDKRLNLQDAVRIVRHIAGTETQWP